MFKLRFDWYINLNALMVSTATDLLQTQSKSFSLTCFYNCYMLQLSQVQHISETIVQIVQLWCRRPSKFGRTVRVVNYNVLTALLLPRIKDFLEQSQCYFAAVSTDVQTP